MATTYIDFKPIVYKAANVCSICGETIPHIQPSGYTLIKVNGQRQKIVDRFEVQQTRSRQAFDIICIVARDE